MFGAWYTRHKPDEVILPDRTEVVRLYREALKSGIGVETVTARLEEHVSKIIISEEVEEAEVRDRSRRQKRRLPKVVVWGATVLPVFFIAIGVYLVGSAVWPILTYYGSTVPSLHAQQLASPIPQDQVMDATPLVISQVRAFQEKRVIEPKVIDLELDYTNLANWFDVGEDSDEFARLRSSLENKQAEVVEELPDEYMLDIPSIDVFNAKVAVGGTDLNKSLIAYPGTALPGNLGSPVIFGHSVLRQFYNPKEKNPRRYTSIFSYIMTLKKGDPIYVTYDGVKYTYIVTSKTEVKPTDVYILGQQYDRKELKLVTCTPEGTYLRRGVITAQLVEMQ